MMMYIYPENIYILLQKFIDIIYIYFSGLSFILLLENNLLPFYSGYSKCLLINITF